MADERVLQQIELWLHIEFPDLELKSFTDPKKAFAPDGFKEFHHGIKLFVGRKLLFVQFTLADLRDTLSTIPEIDVAAVRVSGDPRDMLFDETDIGLLRSQVHTHQWINGDLFPVVFMTEVFQAYSSNSGNTNLKNINSNEVVTNSLALRTCFLASLSGHRSLARSNNGHKGM